MSAPGEPRSPVPVRGVNVVVLRSGEEVHLDDVTSLERAQVVLDDVDAGILAIEDQLAFDAGRSGDPGWRQRAELALKKKRRSRPRIQARMGELRRAERAARQATVAEAASLGAGAKRRAFVDAAEAMLDRDLFTEIWARAQAMRPAAFEDAAGGRP